MSAVGAQAASIPISPLVSKIDFGNDSPLRELRFLMGSGFQFQLKYAMRDDENNPKEERRDAVIRMTFAQYGLSKEFYEGEVLIGMMRNIGDLEFSRIDTADDKRGLLATFPQVVIDMTKTGVHNRLMATYNRINQL